MTNILAIEASEKYCSVALAKTDADGSETRISRFEEAPRKHAELILPMVEALLLESKLSLPAMDCVAFTRGPGAFTGVRIAASLVQGLAFSAEIPVAPISTLELIAYQAAQQDSLFEQGDKFEQGGKRPPIIVALDARMDEVYLGAYEVTGDQVTAVIAEQVAKPENIDWQSLQGSVPVGVGSGWCYHEIFNHSLQQQIGNVAEQWLQDFPTNAEYLLPLAKQYLNTGKVVAAKDAQPVYLRDSVAWQKQTPEGS